MRAVVVGALGGPEQLVVEEVAAPTPAADEVLVRLRATGVNFADTERRRGLFAVPTLPWIPGREGAGVVEACGAAVDPALRGATVAFWSPRASGTYAELATVPAADLFRFPATTARTFAELAALPLQGLTAWGVLHEVGQVRAGQAVLIHAAAGGVGQLLVQLARAAGARVFGTASTEAKRAIVTGLGAEALPYGPDLVAALHARTAGRGVDLVLDSVGRDTQATSLAALAPFGTLVYFGEASGAPAPIVVDDLYPRSLRVGAFGFAPTLEPARWDAVRQGLIARFVAGALTVQVAPPRPLADAADVHRALEGRASTGKLTLDPTR